MHCHHGHSSRLSTLNQFGIGINLFFFLVIRVKVIESLRPLWVPILLCKDDQFFCWRRMRGRLLHYICWLITKRQQRLVLENLFKSCQPVFAMLVRHDTKEEREQNFYRNVLCKFFCATLGRHVPFQYPVLNYGKLLPGGCTLLNYLYVWCVPFFKRVVFCRNIILPLQRKLAFLWMDPNILLTHLWFVSE